MEESKPKLWSRKEINTPFESSHSRLHDPEKIRVLPHLRNRKKGLNKKGFSHVTHICDENLAKTGKIPKNMTSIKGEPNKIWRNQIHR